MGMLDQVLNQALPGGSSGLAKPLMIALGSLAVGRLVSGGAHASAQAATPANAAPNGAAGSAASNVGGAALGGALATGLSGLLQTLQNSGHGNAVKSWVGAGPNQPIQPSQLGEALGQKTVSALAQHTGMNEQQLLTHVASALPGIVDKLTANGTLPSMQQLESTFLQGLQK